MDKIIMEECLLLANVTIRVHKSNDTLLDSTTLMYKNLMVPQKSPANYFMTLSTITHYLHPCWHLRNQCMHALCESS